MLWSYWCRVVTIHTRLECQACFGTCDISYSTTTLHDWFFELPHFYMLFMSPSSTPDIKKQSNTTEILITTHGHLISTHATVCIILRPNAE